MATPLLFPPLCCGENCMYGACKATLRNVGVLKGPRSFSRWVTANRPSFELSPVPMLSNLLSVKFGPL